MPIPEPNLLLISFFIFSLTMAESKSSSTCCNSLPVKPTTPLLNFLQKLQSTALQTFGNSNFDAKLYVDLHLKFDLSTTEAAFNKLPRSENRTLSSEDLRGFLDKYFGGAGSDLRVVEPNDFVLEPVGFLPKVENLEVRKWALEVHALWKNLSRKIDEDVKMRPDSHTMIPLPDSVFIAGSRFREVYYWDSYWVIRGLLASKMYDSAKAIVNNLIFLIEKFGYVLNGSRAYYTNRSQPPLLSAMIFEIYQKTGDLELLRRAFPSLLKEYHFWSSGIHKVTIQDTQGRKHALSRYFAMWNKPRPESATIDKGSASKLMTASAREHFYRELASAAESGWDFSTRWMRNHSDLTTLATTSIIPVDLNSYILQMELNIASFARIIGENSVAENFSAASRNRHEAMNSIFWNAKMDQWLDYWIINNSKCEEVHTWEEGNQNQNIFASNFIPLWIELFNSGSIFFQSLELLENRSLLDAFQLTLDPEVGSEVSHTGETTETGHGLQNFIATMSRMLRRFGFSNDGAMVMKVMKSLKRSGLLHAAGVATSLASSGQQWDFPNGWAPLQHMIVEGLVKSGTGEARSLAEDIAVRWIRTNYAAYKKTGHMYEKYDVEACGHIGGGGEYNAQAGFGWSNGVVLAFLEEFGWPRDRKIDY